MNCHNINYLSLIIFLIFLSTCKFAVAKQTNSTSDILNLDQFLNAIYEWRTNHQQKQANSGLLKLETPTILAGIFCFLAASISSAGGIGGGGLYIPILTIIAGADLKTASSFSAFMVTGGSIANVVCNMFFKCPKNGGNKILIDFDIALLSEPCMLLGVSIGVICNYVLPEWLITIVFVVFLGFSTFKTCKSGCFYWKLESEMENGNQELENGLLKNESVDGTEPLVKKEAKGGRISSIPWKKIGVLVMFWFSFFFLYLLRGNRYGQGIIPMEACGVGYWIISSVQFPLAIIFTSWILYNRISQQNMPSKKELLIREESSEAKHGPSGKLIFPLMALLAGVLGGVFGIGGGMLISPLLIQVGITPEVTAATCSFMVFFSSTMSAVQYLLLGMEHVDSALIFAVVCCVGSIAGLAVVQRAIEHHGRASIIVFSVSTVMALSTLLITSFGVVDIWRDYTSGNYMGFKQLC